MKDQKIREPKVENKYNLKPKDIERAIILDYYKLHKRPFWRNNSIQAWCLSDEVVPNPKDIYGTFDLDYHISFYDQDIKLKKKRIELFCTSYGGMCGYNFENFFDKEEIEDEYDLELQEKLLERINWLIDEGIIRIEEKHDISNSRQKESIYGT